MMHGINHNMFGHRDPNFYGTITYEEINESLKETAAELGVELEIFQSNCEGTFVEKVHEAFLTKVDGVLVNPGGWTNYALGVMDALAILKAPWIEIHMANTFKKHNGTVNGMTTKLASGIVIGLGKHSYNIALRALVELMNNVE